MSRLKVISRTFDRFYNINENPNDEFDPSDGMIVEEKHDGSLISVYFWDGVWRIATRGTAFGEAETASGKTFYDIFIGIIGKPLDEFMSIMPKHSSYTFELCSIDNKVVRVYPIPKLYLINVVVLGYDSGFDLDRNLVDGIARRMGVERPTVYNLKISELIDSFADFEPTDEGYVIIDGDGNRIKVKNPTYVDLHHLKGNGEITPKRIANVVFRGETEEVLGYFPEFKEYFDPFQQRYDEIVNEINGLGDLIADKELSQKEFALRIAHLSYKGVMFGMRKGLTLEESFGKLSSSGKVNLLTS